MAKKRIAVIMGGNSPEYEISLVSGREVAKKIPAKYEVLPIVISRNGSIWRLTTKENLLATGDLLRLKGTNKEIRLQSKKTTKISNRSLGKLVDCVFIAMHGPGGEDGTVQGMLELAGIPYTGPGILASALGMDKLMFRKIMNSHGINVPKYVILDRVKTYQSIKKYIGPLPWIVKPNAQGSSVGMTLVAKQKDLASAQALAFEYGKAILIDKFIKGIELTCAVLGNTDPTALPVVEIKPLKGEFFDYNSKYTESGAEEIVPARITKKQTKDVQKLAVSVYESINASGFSRVDFILDKKGKLFVLEINTIPGLTPMSLFPKAAKAAGISYGRLLDKIIKYAIKP